MTMQMSENEGRPRRAIAINLKDLDALLREYVEDVATLDGVSKTTRELLLSHFFFWVRRRQEEQRLQLTTKGGKTNGK